MHQPISIAILDTGVASVPDLQGRILDSVDFINGQNHPYDDNGHGTHVAGIAVGDGFASGGVYVGVNPKANILSVKILDSSGRGNSSNALAGLQWVYDNAERYNIRVANLSIGTADVGSNDPLVRMSEALWDAGVVVVAAAGNAGPEASTVTSPGSSRKIITVGAVEDSHCDSIATANFSGQGPTSECVIKPNILAAGCDIVSCLSNSPELSLQRLMKMKLVGRYYVRMTGTSMAAPFVSGAVSLLLAKYPNLTPDQVKLMIKYSAVDLRMPPNRQGWGIINMLKFLNGGKK